MTISIGLSSKYHRNINNSTVAMCNDIYVNTDPSPLAINDTRSYFRHPPPLPRLRSMVPLPLWCHVGNDDGDDTSDEIFSMLLNDLM